MLVRLRVIGPAGAPIFVNVSKIDDGLVAALSHGHLVKMLCLIVILPYESPQVMAYSLAKPRGAADRASPDGRLPLPLEGLGVLPPRTLAAPDD